MPWQKLIKAMPVVKDMYRMKNKVFFPVVEGFIIPGQILDLMANGQINPGMGMGDLDGIFGNNVQIKPGNTWQVWCQAVNQVMKKG